MHKGDESQDIMFNKGQQLLKIIQSNSLILYVKYKIHNIVFLYLGAGSMVYLAFEKFTEPSTFMCNFLYTQLSF